jgi:hypothetical protein
MSGMINTSSLGFKRRLLGLPMRGMLAAESAVFFHLQAVRIVFLVFHGIVIPLFALGAGQRYFFA